MNLPGTTKMYPYKLSKSRGVVVFQGFGVSERLKDRITSDKGLVKCGFAVRVLRVTVALANLITHSTD